MTLPSEIVDRIDTVSRQFKEFSDNHDGALETLERITREQKELRQKIDVMSKLIDCFADDLYDFELQCKGKKRPRVYLSE